MSREFITSILVTPNYANFSGVMHGGALVQILDQVAYACATKFCGVGTITMAINNASFIAPIQIGKILHLLANVNYVGKTSLEIGIKAIAEDPKTGEKQHTNSAYFTMLAYENGKKIEIKNSFLPETECEKRRWQNAIKRIDFSKNTISKACEI